MIAVLSVRLLGERLQAAQLADVAVALIGVAVVLFKGSVDNILHIRLTVGDPWIGFAVLSWTASSVIQKQGPSVLDSFARLTVATAAGIVVLIPFTIAEIAWQGLPEPN